MKFMIKSFLFTISFCLLGSLIYAQQKPAEWTKYKELAGVTIEYKYADCDPPMGYDKELVLLRFVNLVDDKVSVEFDLESYHGEKCITCGYSEYHYTVKLQPMQVREGDCTIECDHQLKIFSKFIDPQYKRKDPPLEKFNLNNIQITNSSGK